MAHTASAAHAIETLKNVDLDGNLLKISWGKGKGAESMNFMNFYPPMYTPYPFPVYNYPSPYFIDPQALQVPWIAHHNQHQSEE